jgi:hypothetical protein
MAGALPEDHPLASAKMWHTACHDVTIVEQVPEALRPEVDAAVAWLSARQGRRFAVSGVVDPERALRPLLPAAVLAAALRDARRRAL